MKFFPITFFFILFLLIYSCSKSSSGNVSPITPPPDTTSFSFAKGADISWLTQMESDGYKFYDTNNVQEDCIQILKEKSINSIRLRAWVNPADGWCNTYDVVVKALRAKAAGMRILIDFHYSDVWADPAHQTKPAAWNSLSFDSLVKVVYAYTYHVLDTLKSNGIIPEWVQVGNETNDGMLWEDGRASTNMANFATLVTSGYNAVKAVDDSAKVIVHISNGFNNSLFRWMFDGLQSNGAKWDVIGMSLYPDASNWQSLDNSCLANMNDMISRYGKKVMICEIGMSMTDSDAARSFITDIISKTRSLGQNGLGVFYWEPESYNWQGYTLGAFNNFGKPTIALDGFEN